MLLDSCVVIFPVALFGLLLVMAWLEGRLNASMLGEEIHDYLDSTADAEGAEAHATQRLEEVLRHRVRR